MPDAHFQEIILYWGFAYFEMMHSHWGIATSSILTLRLHLLFMIDAFDGSLSHWHPGFSLLNILGPTWIPIFLCHTPIHPTLDTVIPAPILSEPYIFWAHRFHRLAWPYPFLSWSGEDVDQSRVFCWVFTCLWTLGSTSSVMVGSIRLLIHLGWYSHVDSWYVVSWFAYISDLEFWLAFVWSIILVLLCQHSFSDVWTCFNVCSLRLYMCFFMASSLSISRSVLYGEFRVLW